MRDLSCSFLVVEKITHMAQSRREREARLRELRGKMPVPEVKNKSSGTLFICVQLFADFLIGLFGFRAVWRGIDGVLCVNAGFPEGFARGLIDFAQR